MSFAKYASKRLVKKRFDELSSTLKSHGVLIGAHKRIAIPKAALTEKQLVNDLGFVPVSLAIPESGQTRFKSFRHEEHNHHIHDHGTHWTMHEDSHPAMTMALRRVGKDGSTGLRFVGRATRAVTQGATHIATEGVPGMLHHLIGRIRRDPSALPRIRREMDAKARRTIENMKPIQEKNHAHT